VTAELLSDSWTRIESKSLGYSGRFKGRKFELIQGGLNARRFLEPIHAISELARQGFHQERGLHIRIDSEIPVGVGLGSSAAIAVSTVAAVSKLLDREIDRDTIRDSVYRSEEMIHGTPSGIDQTVSTYGGIIIYARGKMIKHIRPRHPFSLIIGNTGKTRSTGIMVARVREQLNQDMPFKKEVMKSILSISHQAVQAVETGDFKKLGQLMNSNHELLQMIGASTVELNRLVLAARRAGALGAKMTGAGGGGCMAALSQRGKEQRVSRAIKRAGGMPYNVSIDEGGVKAWLCG
jgi:mevalonate kinase